MSDFKKVLAETKTILKNLITKETKQEDIAIISSIDKQLDSLDEAFTEKQKENESLKDDLIILHKKHKTLMETKSQWMKF